MYPHVVLNHSDLCVDHLSARRWYGINFKDFTRQHGSDDGEGCNSHNNPQNGKQTSRDRLGHFVAIPHCKRVRVISLSQ